MNTERDDGGPAFPRKRRALHKDSNGEFYIVEEVDAGMSLRDWYKGKALAYLPMVLNTNISMTEPGVTMEEVPKIIRRSFENAKAMATLAGQLADAMIAERKKNGSP